MTENTTTWTVSTNESTVTLSAGSATVVAATVTGPAGANAVVSVTADPAEATAWFSISDANVVLGAGSAAVNLTVTPPPGLPTTSGTFVLTIVNPPNTGAVATSQPIAFNLPGVGKEVGSIPIGLPAWQVRLSPAGGRAYIRWIVEAERHSHQESYGLAVADLSTNKLIHNFTLEEEPMDIAVTPDGKHVYVSGSDKLYFLDTATFAGSSVPLALPPGTVASAPQDTVPLVLLTGLAITPDGDRLLVAGQQDNQTNGYLAIVDTSTNTVKNAITTDITDEQTHHIAITPDGRFAFVNLDLQSVSIVDLEFLSIVRSLTFTPDSIISMAADPGGTQVYVAIAELNASDGSVVVVDVETAEIKATFALPGAAGELAITSGVAQQLAVSPDGELLYFTTVAANPAGQPAQPPILTVLDAHQGKPIASLANAGPFAISPSGRHAYVFDSGAEALNVLDLSG